MYSGSFVECLQNALYNFDYCNNVEVCNILNLKKNHNIYIILSTLCGVISLSMKTNRSNSTPLSTSVVWIENIKIPWTEALIS